MHKLFLSVAYLRRDERGATATEYGLLVLFIAFALTLGISAFGGALDKAFTDLAGILSVLANSI